MAGVEISLLGGLDIRVAGTAVGDALPRKARALVAYLALCGDKAQSRQELADLFWPDSGDEQVRANLRQALSSIRKAFADESGALIADNERVALDPSRVACDLARFRELARCDDPASLDKAAGLYEGSLLAGINLPGGSLEELFRLEREHCRAKAIAVLTRLCGLYVDQCDWQRCTETAVRLLAIDPLSEEAHRALIRAYGESGRPAEAIKQYEACRKLLLRELGTSPAPQTTALADAVRLRRTADGAPSASGSAATPADDRPSVVVLPLINKGEDADHDFFADGVTENIITGLSRFQEVRVIALKSACAAGSEAWSFQEIGRKLAVTHVAEGSVRRSTNRVRVSVQLVEVDSGEIVWSDRYDRELGDVFGVQDEIGDQIAARLSGQIRDSDIERVGRKRTEDMAAYDFVLRGRQCLNRYTQDGELEARHHFKRALQLEPNSAAACAGLSCSYIHEFEANWSQGPEDALDRAYELAERAVELDDTDNVALYALATVYHYRAQPDLACIQIDRSLELNPNDYHNICAKAWFLAYSGEPDEGIACSLEAIRLNPLATDGCRYKSGSRNTSMAAMKPPSRRLAK